jgi:hypothetical protein
VVVLNNCYGMKILTDACLMNSSYIVPSVEQSTTASTLLFGAVDWPKPVSIAEQSEAGTVFGCLNVEIASWNPAQGMDVCVCISLCCVVLCVNRGLVSG